jgi:tight adherence protein B
MVGAFAVLGAGLMGAVAPPTVLLVTGMAIVGRIVMQRRRRRAERRRSEGQLVAAALETLIGELRIGAHPVRAFTVAAAESAGPVGESLRAVAARARLGADVVAGLRSAAAQSEVPVYWLRLAVFWELAVQHGLPMSVLMRAAHRDIIDRQRFSAQTQAALAGARATALILAGLPGLGVLLGQLIGADPLRFLFGRGMGGAFLVAGVGLIAAGLVWANRIIDRLMT